MLMIEEAMDRAKVDILEKFAKIEEKEDFRVITFGTAVKFKWDIQPDVEDTFASLFDVFVDRSAAKDVEKKNTWTIEDEEQGPGESDEAYLERMEQERKRRQEEKKNKSRKRNIEEDFPVSFNKLQRKRFRMTVEGQYERVFDPAVPGESIMETVFRQKMDYAEVGHTLRLENRLRALDTAVTLYKARQILLECPAKRLLVRYIEATRTEEALAADLVKHFSFKRSAAKVRTARSPVLPSHNAAFSCWCPLILQVARMLRAIVATDYERGRLTRALRVMEVRAAALGHCPTISSPDPCAPPAGPMRGRAADVRERDGRGASGKNVRHGRPPHAHHGGRQRAGNRRRRDRPHQDEPRTFRPADGGPPGELGKDPRQVAADAAVVQHDAAEARRRGGPARP